MKLEQPAKARSKFLQQARQGGSKSREASGVRASASVSSVPRMALAAAQERAARKRERKGDKGNSR